MLEDFSVDCDADLAPKGISRSESDDITKDSGRYTE
jgi:hypothetical protein